MYIYCKIILFQQIQSHWKYFRQQRDQNYGHAALQFSFTLCTCLCGGSSNSSSLWLAHKDIKKFISALFTTKCNRGQRSRIFLSIPPPPNMTFSVYMCVRKTHTYTNVGKRMSVEHFATLHLPVLGDLLLFACFHLPLLLSFAYWLGPWQEDLITVLTLFLLPLFLLQCNNFISFFFYFFERKKK